MHNIKSILYGLVIGLAILLGIGIAISIIYEEEVSQYLIEELNEQLLSEINVKKVNLSLIKKFPQASVEFKDVVAYTKKPYSKKILGYTTDTLFHVKNLSIQINLFDLFAKKYIIKGIHVNNGMINLFIDKYGDPNYIFWSTDENTTDESEFELDINQVKLTNCDILFVNETTKLIIKTNTKRIDFKGNFSNRNYLMQINSEIFIKSLDINNVNYILDRNLKTKLNLDVIGGNLKISNGKVNFNNLSLELNGDIQSSGNKSIDLLISGKNMDVNTFANSLPQNIKNEIGNIEFKQGQATLNLNLFGSNLKTQKLGINALFIINGAKLVFNEKNIELTNLNVDGEYTNGKLQSAKTSKLKFKNIRTEIEHSVFEGNLEIQNFEDPIVKFDLQSKLHLEELKRLFRIDTLEILSGYADAKVKYFGLYKDLKNISLPDLFTREYELDLSINNSEIKFLGNPLILSEISGGIHINKILTTDSLSFKIYENDFLINGIAAGLHDYFLNKNEFQIDAQLKSRKIDLNELSPLFKVNKHSENNSAYKFPDFLSLNLNLNIENFEVGKFNATNISGELNYKPRMFSLHEISFNAMNGNVKAGGVIIQKYNNNFVVKSQSQLTDINMNKLFYSFNNFGQTFITNQNLQGDITGKVSFGSEWNNKLEIDHKSVIAECEINLINGELNNFEPMMGLSKFINIDELKEIKFSEFGNTITIKNEKIYIPQMDIVSSVLNISASGEHSFNGYYQYHVSLLLSDLLSAKFKKTKHKESFNDLDEDNSGKIHLNLLLEGDKENFAVKRDKKTARQKRKQSLQSERTELKQILSEEFGNAVNDSLRKTGTIQSTKFKIDFEEKKSTQEKKTAKEPQQNPKFIIEWEEDSTENN